MRILSVVGARPNFMKLAPVDRELAKRPDVEHVIVHTGQHYDPEMSATFFEQLWIPAPDYHLDVGSGSHAQQTARVMQRLEHRKPTGRREIELGGEQRGREEGELGRLFRLPPARRDLGNALQRCGLHAGQPMHRPAAPTTPGSVW